MSVNLDWISFLHFSSWFFRIFSSLPSSLQVHALLYRKKLKIIEQQNGHNYRKVYSLIFLIAWTINNHADYIFIVYLIHCVFYSIETSMQCSKWTSVNFEITHWWHILLSIFWTQFSNRIEDREIRTISHNHIDQYSYIECTNVHLVHVCVCLICDIDAIMENRTCEQMNAR